MNKGHKKLCTICTLLLCILLFSGCTKIDEDTKVVLTTGFDKDEVFRIENQSCRKNEVLVYLTNIKNQYSDTYGSQIWDMENVESSLGRNIKESVLAELAEIKTMNLMAQQYGIELSEQEMELVQSAAKEYYASLNKTEKELLEISGKDIASMYQEYAIAGKVYDEIIKDVNPEISDDEARIVTVEKLVVGYVKGSKSDQYAAQLKMKEVQERLEAGDDFEMLMTQYGESGTETISFGKGSQDAQLEQIAFDLGAGEISMPIDRGDGIWLIKCTSTFNKEETDLNKIKIVEERQREMFNQEYESFVGTLTRNINEELWDSITFIESDEVTCAEFFTIYESYFK